MSKTKRPSQPDLLIRMAFCQQRCFSLLLESDGAKRRGNLDEAIALSRELVEVNGEQLQLAEQYNRDCAEPIDTKPIAQPLINTLNTLADFHQSRGQLGLAEPLRDDAQRLAREYFGDAGNALAQRQRAASLISLGRFTEALIALAVARDFYEAEENRLEMARVTIDIAGIRQWLGDFERAEADMQHAAAMLDAIPATSNLQHSVDLQQLRLRLNHDRALVLRWLGCYSEAERLFQEVLPEYERLGVRPSIEYQLAAILVAQGDVETGLARAASLEPVFIHNQNFRPKYAGLLRLMADGQLRLKQPQMALQTARKALSDLEQFVDPDLLWRVQWLEASALRVLGNLSDALAAYHRCVATIAQLRIAPLGFRLDSTFLQDKWGIYEDAVSLCAEIDRPRDACAIIEQIKSRTLSTVLSVSRGQRPSNDALRRRFDELTDQLNALEYSGYSGVLSADQVARQRIQFLQERSEMLERVRFSDDRWRGLSEPVGFNLDDVLASLDRRGQAALNLFLIDDEVVTVLLTAKQVRIARQPLDVDVRRRLHEYLSNLQALRPNPLGFDASREFVLGAKHFVSQEFLTAALSTNGLIVIPHGVLHLLPWSGLIFNARRLFEYCPIGMLPNLSCITPKTEPKRIPTGVGLIGDPDYGELTQLSPLKSAGDELAAIQQLYESGSRVVHPVCIASSAKSDGFYELAAKADGQGGILHIACHGTYDPTEPMSSGLLLSDAKIDAAEIANQPLRWAEVVLSACNSGWRPMQVGGVSLVGDDILGLPAAFLEAGASSVLVSIPEAGDRASRELTVKYHEERLKGNSPMAALQVAQKYMLNSGSHQPCHWMGFVVYSSH